MLALEEKNNLSNDLQSTKKKLEEIGNQKVSEWVVEDNKKFTSEITSWDIIFW